MAEIVPALERGVIDAAEFVGPYQDRRLGLQKAAKNYYTTGWHEPGTVSELLNEPAHPAFGGRPHGDAADTMELPESEARKSRMIALKDSLEKSLQTRGGAKAAQVGASKVSVLAVTVLTCQPSRS